MLTNGKSRLEIGDWVRGKSGGGELLHGYIESVDSLQDIVKVHVVACDNKETVGKTIRLPRKWLEKLPAPAMDREGYILSLIDLALETRDKQWFLELFETLTVLQTHTKESDTGRRRNSAPNDRLRVSGILE